MKKSERLIIEEGLGWYGVLAILLAYGLVSFSLVRADGIVYQLLNATGAGGIIFSSLHKKDYQPVALNVVWLLIAGVAMLRLLF